MISSGGLKKYFKNDELKRQIQLIKKGRSRYLYKKQLVEVIKQDLIDSMIISELNSVKSLLKNKQANQVLNKLLRT